ncbi:MAG: DNA repair protein RadA [Acidimicrobiales bacterium]
MVNLHSAPGTAAPHRCTGCGHVAPRWTGRCTACGEWNTLVAGPAQAKRRGRATAYPVEPALPIGQVTEQAISLRPTGVPELDRVLGGGLVAGSVTLLGGEPGIGKSTLLLQVLGSMSGCGARCLLVCAEESAAQVRARAERLGAMSTNLWLLAESSLEAISATVEELRPDVVAVDSVQTILASEPAGSAQGSVAQVTAVSQGLSAVARRLSCSLVLVGHVTKDGALAGPRALEHLVDTVVSFEGDRHHSLRLVRALKHRFGATGELGLLSMGDDGLSCVADASSMFLADRREGVAGSVISVTIEGRRPLTIELQALVAQKAAPQLPPRRFAQGIDAGRLALLLAVLHQRAGVAVGDQDVFASVAGGTRMAEPGGDLALAIALASARSGRAVDPGTVAIAEVGLGGELRQAPRMESRLAEAARIGFTAALVAESCPDGPAGMKLLRFADLRAVVSHLGLRPGR